MVNMMMSSSTPDNSGFDYRATTLVSDYRVTTAVFPDGAFPDGVSIFPSRVSLGSTQKNPRNAS